MCKAILYSQNMERYHSAFLQSPLPRGKLNWCEFLKTSWTICSRPCGNIGEDWTRDSHPLANLQGLVTDYTPHTHTGAWLPPLPLPGACWFVCQPSHNLIWKHWYSTYLESHLPKPIFTVISAAFLSHPHDYKKLQWKKGKTVQSTKCFTNTLLSVKETSQTSALKMPYG